MISLRARAEPLPAEGARPASGPRPLRAAAWLRVLWVPGAAASRAEGIALGTGEEVTVGRAPGSSLRVEDGRISRTHLSVRLGPEGDRVVLQDRSVNGTRVNGRRMKAGVLEDGDVIRLGDSFLLLRFVPEGVPDADVPALVGAAPAARVLRREVARVGATGATALIMGESGTGRRLAARAMHEASRREGAFVCIDCASIPEQQAERRLFGEATCPPSGPTEQSLGLLRSAEGGTLLLHEADDLPRGVQSKLLRALRDRVVTPVGATQPVAIDVRLLASAREEVGERVGEGALREDLYAYLSGHVLHVPALRRRREDILPILRRALSEDSPPLSPDLVGGLLGYHWPYNVREVLKVGRELRLRGADAERLELSIVQARLERDVGVMETERTMRLQGSPGPDGSPTGEAARTADAPPPTRDELTALLARSKGNISYVSRETGRSRRQVYRYLEEHGLRLEGFREE